MVTLVLAIVGTFYLTNYANSQRLTSDSEAAKSCLQISCGSIQAGATGNFYAKNRKYYEDKNCNTELTQGVGNFCRGNKTGGPTPKDLCIKRTCPDNTKRVYYEKAGKFYGNSTCTGAIAKGTYCSIPSTTPGTGTRVACLTYDCTSVDSVKGISGRKYSVQEGMYYQGPSCNTRIQPLVGVGKYCRGTYVKFSCYNWWNAFDTRNAISGEHDTLETDLDRSKAVYTNDNGLKWALDTKGTALSESVHDYCTL